MRLARWLGHPTRVIPTVYLGAIAVGTVLLMLPAATRSQEPALLIHAAFTSVSAICITGLVTVDTATYWSGFGRVVIMLLIQVAASGSSPWASSSRSSRRAASRCRDPCSTRRSSP